MVGVESITHSTYPLGTGDLSVDSHNDFIHYFWLKENKKRKKKKKKGASEWGGGDWESLTRSR